MPHVVVKLYSGAFPRADEALAEAVTQAVTSTLNYGEGQCRTRRTEALDRAGL